MIPASYRVWIYRIVVAAMVALLAFDVVSTSELTDGVVVAERIIAALTALLAMLNVNQA